MKKKQAARYGLTQGTAHFSASGGVLTVRGFSPDPGVFRRKFRSTSVEVATPTVGEYPRDRSEPSIWSRYVLHFGQHLVDPEYCDEVTMGDGRGA